MLKGSLDGYDQNAFVDFTLGIGLEIPSVFTELQVSDDFFFDDAFRCPPFLTVGRVTSSPRMGAALMTRKARSGLAILI